MLETVIVLALCLLILYSITPIVAYGFFLQRRYYEHIISKMCTCRGPLPRPDLLHQMAYLSWATKQDNSPALATAFENTKNIVGRMISEYPEEDWDNWWEIMYQIEHMYENTGRQ